jgi:hypothetical protein
MALQGVAASRRRRLTIAPTPHRPPAGEGSSTGSRFSCLGSDASGSDSNDGAVPKQVALQALLDENVEEGWTLVVHRRRKPGAEVIQDFWREIGFPTSAARFWEKARTPSCAGESPLFCRSVDVHRVAAGSSPSSSSQPSPPWRVWQPEAHLLRRLVFASPGRLVWGRGGGPCRRGESRLPPS